MNRSRTFPLPANTLLVSMCSAVLLMSAPARAGIVYSNGAPNYSGALLSDAVLPTQSTLGVGQQGAELLRTPATPADPANDFHVVTGLRFWGSYLGGPLPPADDFTVTLSFSHNIDQLLYIRHFAAGEVQRSATPVGYWSQTDALGQAQQVAVYEYQAPMPVALQLDSEMYLSIVNETSGDAANWAWALSGGGDGDSLWRNHPGWWAARETDYAFQLLGPGDDPMPVSEPAASWLAALAALVATTRRARSRKAQPG